MSFSEQRQIISLYSTGYFETNENIDVLVMKEMKSLKWRDMFWFCSFRVM